MQASRRLFSLLVCPQTGGALMYEEELSELWCKASRLAYPVVDGVPHLLVDKARQCGARSCVYNRLPYPTSKVRKRDYAASA